MLDNLKSEITQKQELLEQCAQEISELQERNNAMAVQIEKVFHLYII
jgi:hypothetical protein